MFRSWGDDDGDDGRPHAERADLDVDGAGRRTSRRDGLADPIAATLPVALELRRPLVRGIISGERELQHLRIALAGALTGRVQMTIDARAEIERRHLQLVRLREVVAEQ